MSLPTERVRPTVISDRVLHKWEELTPRQRGAPYPQHWTRPRPERPKWKPDPRQQQGYELSSSYSNVRTQGHAETSFGGDGLRRRVIGKWMYVYFINVLYTYIYLGNNYGGTGEYSGNSGNIRREPAVHSGGTSDVRVQEGHGGGSEHSEPGGNAGRYSSSDPLLRPGSGSILGSATGKLVPASIVAGTVTGLAAGGIIASSVGGKEGGYTLPGHDYLGPGNTIGIDAPKTGSDAVAKEHDVSYSNLIYDLRAGHITEEQFVRNIQQADKKAIEQFAEWYDTTGDWAAFVGKYGLGLKHWIETKVGHLYPRAGKCKDTINLLPMNVRTGNDLTRASDDTHGSSITLRSSDEGYPLTIPFQSTRTLGTQTYHPLRKYLTREKILKLISKKTITTSYSIVLKSIIQAVLVECLRHLVLGEEQ